jgi:hypothetical protein
LKSPRCHIIYWSLRNPTNSLLPLGVVMKTKVLSGAMT